jgi:membrane-associated protease RseP (regulator of RpoE activity)
MSTTLVLLIAFIVYCIIVAVLWKLKVLEKYNIAATGPILMIKTQKGITLLRKVASRPKLWKKFGNFSVVSSAIIMALGFLQVVWVASLSTYVPREAAPSPRLLIGVPGLNPIIPIYYGILGLAVALIVHEFSHGILTLVGKIKLKSVGLLFCLFPIGAFVEPDEEEMLATKKIKRMRVFAVGPMMNMVVCFICALLFSFVFMASMQPVHDGCGILVVGDDDPAGISGMESGMIIAGADGTTIEDPYDFFLFMNSTQAGQTVEFQMYQKGADGPTNVTVELAYNANLEVLDDRAWYKQENGFLGVDVANRTWPNAGNGVEITTVIQHSPAEYVSLDVGMVITELGNSTISNTVDFNAHLGAMNASQGLLITYMPDPDNSTSTNQTTATLGMSKGYLGVYTSVLFNNYDMSYTDYAAFISRPFKGADDTSDVLGGFFRYIALPLVRLSPMDDGITQFYEVPGWGGAEPAFWLLANSVYWIFWINLMLGLTNVLPLIPLDGGYLFKDFMDTLGRRLGLKKPEKFAKRLTAVFSLAVLFCIIWIMVGPRLNIFG